MKSIVLVNQPTGNRGDESAHRAFIFRIRKEFPEAKIIVLFLSVNPEAVDAIRIDDSQVQYENIQQTLRGSHFLARWSVRIGWVMISILHPSTRAIVEILRMADLVVSAPGGMCMGGFQNWLHLYFLYLAKALNKPLGYFGRSIGPFPKGNVLQRIFRKRSIEILNYCEYVSLRDSCSEEVANEIEIDFNPTIDSAFLRKPDPVQNKMTVQKRGLGITAPYIVFVPNSLSWHVDFACINQYDLVTFYRNVIRRILEHGWASQVVMIPQLNCQPAISDYDYFLRISQGFDRDKVIVLEDTYSSDFQQAIISESDFVIGARYHSIVFAINNGIPFASLSYEGKMRGMLIKLGLQDRLIDLEALLEGKKSYLDLENEVFEIINQRDRIDAFAIEAAKIANDGFASFARFASVYLG